jgi:hypothetical protein
MKLILKQIKKPNYNEQNIKGQKRKKDLKRQKNDPSKLILVVDATSRTRPSFFLDVRRSKLR